MDEIVLIVGTTIADVPSSARAGVIVLFHASRCAVAPLFRGESDIGSVVGVFAGALLFQLALDSIFNHWSFSSFGLYSRE